MTVLFHQKHNNIRYAIYAKGLVDVSIQNSFGITIRELVSNEFQESGKYVVPFECSALAPGVYFCVVKSNGLVAIQKVVII